MIQPIGFTNFSTKNYQTRQTFKGANPVTPSIIPSMRTGARDTFGQMEHLFDSAKETFAGKTQGLMEKFKEFISTDGGNNIPYGDSIIHFLPDGTPIDISNKPINMSNEPTANASTDLVGNATQITDSPATDTLHAVDANTLVQGETVTHMGQDGISTLTMEKAGVAEPSFTGDGNTIVWDDETLLHFTQTGQAIEIPRDKVAEMSTEVQADLPASENASFMDKFKEFMNTDGGNNIPYGDSMIHFTPDGNPIEIPLEIPPIDVPPIDVIPIDVPPIDLPTIDLPLVNIPDTGDGFFDVIIKIIEDLF